MTESISFFRMAVDSVVSPDQGAEPEENTAELSSPDQGAEPEEDTAELSRTPNTIAEEDTAELSRTPDTIAEEDTAELAYTRNTIAKKVTAGTPVASQNPLSGKTVEICASLLYFAFIFAAFAFLIHNLLLVKRTHGDALFYCMLAVCFAAFGYLYRFCRLLLVSEKEKQD